MTCGTTKFQKYRGFTLVELMVVIVIIFILGGITVGLGMSAKTSANIRSTRVTLKLLDGVMKEYLAAGNTEPQTGTTAWVSVLRASPEFSKKISSLKTGNNGAEFLDGFGMAIGYVQFNDTTQKPGYFRSPGPDKKFDTDDDLLSTDVQ